ncbi:hypothetical protein CesoFtcFv8_002996 [Champsocephalus esox]|uniref:Uncharacterized protein n=1 Tax=Champsocephalus esox TaxID=159716 RepID=A0AAN8HEY2_9TELE|nr:hypothetical protein CesoFtcFv8_002996 [Champsocephalus esox]
MWSGNVDVLVGYLVVLWVEQFGQLVEDEPRVVDGASEDVVHQRVQVMGCQNSVCRSKPRPHHQHGSDDWSSSPREMAASSSQKEWQTWGSDSPSTPSRAGMSWVPVARTTL